MEISRLQERIMIQSNEVVIDTIGNHKNVWCEYYSCFAHANTYTVDETSDVVTHENQTISFSIRACQKVKSISHTKYRVKFKGQIYDIVAVDMMNYSNKEIKLRCKLEVRQ